MQRLRWLIAMWLAINVRTAVAQRLSWERPLSFGSTNEVFGYAQVLANGDYVVQGIKSAGTRYPFVLARYQPNGALVRQQTGRTLITLEQDLVSLGSAGFLLAASVPEGNAASLFFQRLRPNGDTLPGRRYPRALLEGYPVRAVRDGDSVRVLVVAVDRVQVNNYLALVTTDTAGIVGSVRRYANPAPGTVYASDMVRTARGTWLLVSEFAPVGADFRPGFLEIDARGRSLRQRAYVLFPSGGQERVRRIANNLIRLTDGSGYVFSGWHKTNTQTWGFLCKLDTALNVVWTYRHPPQATANLNPSRVYELPDGSLGWLAGDEVAAGQPLTNKLYFIRVSAAGQLLGQRTFTSAACAQLRLYSWQPLPNGGALVTGGYGACGTAGGLVTYTARLDSATVLAARPGLAGSDKALIYPNPATETATWQGAVPVGTPVAALQVLDGLGRVVRTVAVGGRGAGVAQVLPLAGLLPGPYVCRLLLDGLPVGSPQRFTLLP